ncbi:lysozyme inhibitor LprI family protein [Lysobacter sp. 22409]|uniref:lysozyme inhibitor LprI family protein n=1 Tax=Lysobacter sp. 22409 TaxID=3453917 RepID=UPI003F874E32
MESTRQLSWWFAVSYVLSSGVASLVSPALAADAAYRTQEMAEEPSNAGASADCSVVSEIEPREACFAAKSDAEIAECERVRMHACKPYKEMHALDRELIKASRDVLSRALRQYASYVGGDEAYLDDLSSRMQTSDRMWRAYRDADCRLEPFLQGMSRQEADGLSEACRVERTKARLRQLRQLAEPLTSGE